MSGEDKGRESQAQGFWAAVRWPLGEAVNCVTATFLFFFGLGLLRVDPWQAFLVAEGVAGASLIAWAFCRIAIAALRRPSRGPIFAWVKKTLLWLLFEDNPNRKT